MKNIIIRLLTFFFAISLVAQKKEVKKTWTSYSQSIDVSDKENMAFRVSAFIRKDSVNKRSKSSIWVRVDKKDRSRGFFKNNVYDKNIIVSDTWQKFEIKGIIDEGASNLYFGAFCMDNGDFYFDDFKLEVKNKKGVWEDIKIDNGGFEGILLDGLWNQGTHKSYPFKIKNFEIKRSKVTPYKGNYSLHIKGRGLIGNNNGKYVTVNNVKLYYEVYGKGDPLLLLHGNGQSINGFIHQVDEFKKHYKVIIVDCRGRGNSTYDYNNELTYDLEADDIKLFLDKINIEKAHILGWSDGGIIGLLMAIKYPEKVDKLIAIGANINPEGLVDVERFIKKVYSLKKEPKSDDNDLIIARYELMINYPKLDYKDLNVITAKTLFVAGDHDLIKNIHTIKMFEAIKNAQLAILPNETHYFPSENPTFFNEIALKFLK